MFKLAMMAALGWRFGNCLADIADGVTDRLADRFNKSNDPATVKMREWFEKTKANMQTETETKNRIGF